ncbi:uncharacterized protein DUF4259 [Variovorax sp. 54]|uniref:DUF4259 domain-containing protein n=1 Tax=Variovorax sp. 54 TaxID=2035212 RepID=UPI000C17A1BC|nr:DUF4259 domain-containing protein [Variovorax sp. 54]PIF78283.1 uncharacterized protein DUF4259 [Variovorax sp. 54]
MGTWSTAGFGNDDALDWLAELQEADDALAFIQETLDSGSTEGTVAASEVLALLAGQGSADAHPDAVDWCAGKAAPPAALRHAAADALLAILDDPDADGHDTWAELGEDDEDYLAWLANLKSLQARLRS